MDEGQLFSSLIWALFGLSAIAFLMLMFIPAPYGRFVRRGWGPEIPSRVGWIVMETPAVVVFAWAFFSGEHWHSAAPLVLFGLWQTHYVYRTFVYPFRMRGPRTMTLLIMLSVFLFVTAPYGYLNGRYLSHFGDYPTSWLVDPRFLVGASLFVIGLVINFQSDHILIKLRQPGHRIQGPNRRVLSLAVMPELFR